MAKHQGSVSAWSLTRSLTSEEITKIVAGMVAACVIMGVPNDDLRRLIAGLRVMTNDPNSEFAKTNFDEFGEWAVPIAGMVGSLLQWNSKPNVVEALACMERSWGELFDEFTPHVPGERPRN
jgi:hypothetical protein